MNRRAGIGVILLATLFVFFLLALIAVGYGIGGYNKAVRLDESVKNGWAQVENQLKRRYDLIPNLVETVKGYAAHEQELFTQIAKSRERYFAAGSRDEKVDAANGLERALSRLLVLKETYPELKAQEGFLKLQDELAGTENRLAVERKRFNDAVTDLNRYTRSFFGRMFSGWAGVKEAAYFEAPPEAEQTPKVNFGKP